MSKRGSNYKSWPFKEAARIIKGAGKDGPPADAVFQTGFGPSGLPHIGTFAEVARTTWVRRAYEKLTESERTGREKIVGITFELDSIRLFRLFAMTYLGMTAELAREVPQLLAEALDRGDYYAATNMQLRLPNVAWLVLDQPEDRPAPPPAPDLWSYRRPAPCRAAPPGSARL